MIDRRGYRLNVGIIVANEKDQVLFCQRQQFDKAWQFPQGGVHNFETLNETMFRELQEELGLEPSDVEILGVTRKWLYYDLPKRFLRQHIKPLCVGQKQKWFLLRLLSDESRIDFYTTDHHEFEQFKWVDYWEPADRVVDFKQAVYRKALTELEAYLTGK